MKNNNAVIFKRIVEDYKVLIRKAPDIVGIIAVELFKQSFQKRGEIQDYGVHPWTRRGFGPKNRSGAALLKKTGQLQRSIRYFKQGKLITIYTNEKYAQIQNDGGTIKVTPEMRRFFYAMWKKSGGDYEYQDGQLVLTSGDDFWFRMFRARKIKIPPRPFFYNTAVLEKRLDKKFSQEIKLILNKK